MAIVKVGSFNLDEFYCGHLRLRQYNPTLSNRTELDLERIAIGRPRWKSGMPSRDILRAGIGVFKACWLNRDKLPESLRDHQQIFFDGEVLVNEFECELVFYLRWTKRDWNKENSPMDWRWGVCGTGYAWGTSFPALFI